MSRKKKKKKNHSTRKMKTKLVKVEQPADSKLDTDTETGTGTEPIINTSSFWQKHMSASLHPLAFYVLRCSFFLLLAYDLWWIALSHAPRYGAGHFNVAHFAWMSHVFPMPTVDSVSVFYLALGVLSVAYAVGLTGRLGVSIIAIGYNFVYFWSQADSYQHHYLIGLCLFIFAFFPSVHKFWKTSDVIKDRALDLLFIQLSLIYFWTAIAKCEAVWLSGSTLSNMVHNVEVKQTILQWGQTFSLSNEDTFQVLAWLVFIGELSAAGAWLFRVCRPWAVLVIPWFHIMVEWIGFDIELFSYYMLILNVCLLTPYRVWHQLYLMIDRLLITPIQNKVHTVPSINPTYGVIIFFWVISSTLIAFQVAHLPLENTEAAAYVTCFILLGLTYPIFQHLRHISSSIVLVSIFLFTGVTSIACHHLKESDFAFNYYRMWGGDLKRRGEYQKSIEIYQKVNQYQKENKPARHITLASIYQRLGQNQNAIDMYQEGIRRWSLKLHDAEATLPNKEAQSDFQRAIKKLDFAYKELKKVAQQNSQFELLQEIDFLWQEERKFIQQGYQKLR